MAFHEDLIEQSYHLARRDRNRPRQASLRRAVSTAYYALFHLLISEATQNWKRADQRHQFARLFEHGKMKSASEKVRSECRRIVSSGPGTKAELDQGEHLYEGANAFFEAQQQRHLADYDNSRRWTRTEVLEMIGDVEAGIHRWRAVRETPAAQAYLLSLLGGR